jgi:hypothetical protein
MDEVKGEWIILHKKELCDLYSLSNTLVVIKSSRMRKVGHVALMGDNRGVYRILVWKPEGNRPVGRLKKGGRIILIGSSINGMGRHRWTDLAKGRDKW